MIALELLRIAMAHLVVSHISLGQGRKHVWPYIYIYLCNSTRCLLLSNSSSNADFYTQFNPALPTALLVCTALRWLRPFQILPCPRDIDKQAVIGTAIAQIQPQKPAYWDSPEGMKAEMNITVESRVFQINKLAPWGLIRLLSLRVM